jgi:predicted nucleic acid-binding protein
VTVFVDTSALYALLSRHDPMHQRAAKTFRGLGSVDLLTHNYVVVESCALVHRRLGQSASTDLVRDILAPIELAWVDETVHRVATEAFLAAGSEGPSLVDCTSFEVMRRRAIATAFAFDRHFEAAGFAVLGSEG